MLPCWKIRSEVKRFAQAALQTLPKFGVSNIDALLITHGHADAMLGMDDLRDLQAAQTWGKYAIVISSVYCTLAISCNLLQSLAISCNLFRFLLCSRGCDKELLRFQVIEKVHSEGKHIGYRLAGGVWWPRQSKAGPKQSESVQGWSHADHLQ